MRKEKLLSFLFLISFALNILAQSRTISGKVFDEDGQPIIGVNIIVKGTKTGTLTNLKGEFTINSTSLKSILVFSYIGYEKKEVEITKNNYIKVVLSEDAKNLNEVVVVGYGEQKRMDITGAVGSVKTADLAKAPVVSFEQALQGRVAGVNVSSSEGDPGSAMNINIRGQSSITQSNSPLYVIDGFAIENFNANTLNSSDIASIDVLKDASATSIYGARAANGVILITTKSGKEGRPVVSYDGYIGYSKDIKRMELLTPYEFVKLQFDLNPVSTTGFSYANPYLHPDANGVPTMTIEDYKNVQGVDWQSKIMQLAPMQSHTLSLSGGTKATKYAVSINYLDQQGVILNSGFNRFQGRIKLDQVVNDKLKVGVNFNYSQTLKYGTAMRFNDQTGSDPSFSLLYNVYGFRPISATVSMDEFLNNSIENPVNSTSGLIAYNPVQYLKNEFKNTNQTNVLANFYAEYAFTRYLKLRSTVGLNNNFNNVLTFYNSFHPSAQLVGGMIKGANGSQSYVQDQTFLNENTLNYNRVFNKVHSFNVMAGFTINNYWLNTFGGTAYMLPIDVLGVYGLKQGVQQPLVTNYQDSRLLSYLGRVNYNYKQKIYATITMRADGSSKFPTKNRWGYFPSASLAWRVSGETFMKSLKFISDAKLRLGYGEIGNNRVGSYDYLSYLDLSTISGYPFNNVYQPGATVTTLGNSSLMWETTKSYNGGVDLSLFKNRISLTADYYNKNTSNLLLNANVSPSSGFTRAKMNIGQVQNSGLELTLNTININSKDFSWTSSLNTSWNRNQIVALNDGQSDMQSTMQWNQGFNGTPLYIAKVGQPIAQFYGYKWDGMYQIDDFTWIDNVTDVTVKLPDNDPTIPYSRRIYTLKGDVTDNGNARSTIKPGHIKYVDQTGDKHIDSNDLTVIGNPNPVFTGGFNNNFTYKNFDINLFFQFSVGGQIMNASRMLFEGTYRSDINQFASYADHWTPENQGSKNYAPGGNGPNVYSDRTVEDGSYLRLKTVQIGYTLPSTISKTLKIESLRFYSSAQNIYTLTRYSGMDPEVSINNSALTPGFDYLAYPRSLTITLGVNAKF
jgi:TonB-linked SusC/RagA family outer membrane protein